MFSTQTGNCIPNFSIFLTSCLYLMLNWKSPIGIPGKVLNTDTFVKGLSLSAFGRFCKNISSDLIYIQYVSNFLHIQSDLEF